MKIEDILQGTVEINSDELGLFLYKKVNGEDSEILPMEVEAWKDTGAAAAQIFADVWEYLMETYPGEFQRARYLFE